MPRITAEQVWRGILRGPLQTVVPSSNPWAGITTITTASNLASVATTRVQSGDLIFFTPVQANSLNVGPIAVKSITTDTGFTFGFTDATTLAVNVSVMWMLHRAV